MRLVTYRLNTEAPPRVGVLAGEQVVDAQEPGVQASHSWGSTGPGSMLDLLRAGRDGLGRARAALQRADGNGDGLFSLEQVQLCPPLPRPNSIRDFMLVEEHVQNSFGRVPSEWHHIPAHWKGNPDTVFGPDDEVPWPHYTDKLDYELEVAAVLGRPAHNVSADEAADCIAGYTIYNDWSARDIQFREMQVGIGPAFGKDFATSLGPCITTPDEFDVSTARMTARVNGEPWSEGSLGSMAFTFAEVISVLSTEQPLRPGDVFGGGTVGRGCGLELDRWIRPGDVVELEVDGIGVLRNIVGAKRVVGTQAIDLTIDTNA